MVIISDRPKLLFCHLREMAPKGNYPLFDIITYTSTKLYFPSNDLDLADRQMTLLSDWLTERVRVKAGASLPNQKQAIHTSKFGFLKLQIMKHLSSVLRDNFC